MFAVELLFNDGISPDELIVVRRQSFILGSSQEADVILEGSSGAITPIRIERRRGRRFSAIPLEDDALPQIFNGEGELRVGEIILRIIPLDLDIVIASSQSMESAASRVLARALDHKPPEFPAIEIIGATNCVISFAKDQEVLIGKSRNCAIRLDEDGIHQEHAKVGCYANASSLSEFWFEPFPGAISYLEMEQPISHKVDISTGQSVILSPGKCSIRFLLQEEENKEQAEPRKKPSLILNRYPCIVSRSELMKPERYPLSLGRKVSLGRDPSNEIWFNATHISRLHAEIVLDPDPVNEEKNSVSITDFSSNGTYIDGARLQTEVRRTLPDKLTVVDLSKGLTFALCFNEQQEEEYLGRKPIRPRKSSSLQGQILSQIQIPLTPFNSDEDSFGNSEKPSWFSSSQLKPDQDNFSAFNTAQSEAFTPLLSSDSAGNSFSQPSSSAQHNAQNQQVAEEEVPFEEFAPLKRFGLTGKIMFWSAFVVLIVVNYFVYLGR